MPLKIIREDITRILCDAIVNPTNERAMPDGGLDLAIHRAAGEALLPCLKKLGSIPVGSARITPGFDLPARFIIHTVGPVWQGGAAGEREQLHACYRASMELALQNGCRSIAFPLISSGLHAYPKDRVLREAVAVLSEYLLAHEVTVYLVVYDKASFEISRALFDAVTAFVDENYIEAHADREDFGPIAAKRYMRTPPRRTRDCSEDAVCFGTAAQEVLCERMPDLGEMLANMDKGFCETLLHYIDLKGISDVEAYKRANVDRKTFSKIKCNKGYRPSKLTVIAFAIGLHLNIKETEHLLSTAGMCLSRSNKLDVIIEYFILSGKYETVHDVNEVLYQFDQALLGV